MNGRNWLRMPLVFGLVLALVMGSFSNAQAQSRTSDAVACVDAAANELKQCVDDLPGWAEALCYARYASDSILCAPTILFK